MAEKRMRLYRAVKHEVDNYRTDHGYSLAEMWAIVTGENRDADFWLKVCINDYARDVLR